MQNYDFRPALDAVRNFVRSLESKHCCENCGANESHQTDPLFGDGPPHFTCKTDEDMVGSQHEY